MNIINYMVCKKCVLSQSFQDKKHLALTELEGSRLSAVVKVLKDTSHYHSSKISDVDVAMLLRLLKMWPLAMIFPGWNGQPIKMFCLIFSCFLSQVHFVSPKKAFHVSYILDV